MKKIYSSACLRGKWPAITLLLLMIVSKSVFAQDSVSITINATNTPIEQVFRSIEQQTAYTVLYNTTLLNPSEKVSVNVRRASLERTMAEVLKGKELTWSIKGTGILILPKKEQGAPSSSKDSVSGRVTDSDGNPLAGVTVRVKNGGGVGTVTDGSGRFEIGVEDENSILLFTSIGFLSIQRSAKDISNHEIRMVFEARQIKEIEVSTGYEKIPPERSTGAFTFIDNELFNRTVSPDILTRLKGVTSSLLFDLSTSTGNPLGISVRGRSTIFSNTQPLIIVDNFPFEGDLNTLNPNDIANVTILKDAAAASIWGTRAGNGVIVITTKRGSLSKSSGVTFNTNLTIGKRPNLFFEDQLTAAEYTNLEKFLFNNGWYTSTINNGYSTISPVIELLQKQKNGELTEDQVNREIDKYNKLDIRDQLSKYYYRPSIHQQYHVNVSGGNQRQLYFLSAGYDHNLPNNVGESDNRFTLKGNNTYNLLDDQLNVSADITFTSSNRRNYNPSGYTPLYPYDQIADDFGNATSVLQVDGLRESFTDTIGGGKLLDWKYRPLEELTKKYITSNSQLTDYRLNVGINYKIIKSLYISANYQFYRASRENDRHSDEESFEVRNLLNSTSIQDDITGDFSQALPLGDILSNLYNSLKTNAGRIQLTFNKTINQRHKINGIAGYEVREDRSQGYSNTIYGYNPDLATHVPVNLASRYQYFHRPGSFTPSTGNRNWTTDRFISYFVNGSYTYDHRFIATASFRKDESNLFGVKANQKGVPLWSAGLAWNLHNESFLTNSWISNLKIRSTYGFNGNVNKSLSAYLTSSPFFTNTYNENIAQVVNPPNAGLRWERVENLNFGLDFSIKNDRIHGSIDYYVKNGRDLIGQSPYPPQTGIIVFTGNVANSHTSGIDVLINTINLDGAIKWYSTGIFNLSKDQITDYFAFVGSNENIISPGVARITPLKGFPINALFAYKWAGLSKTGAPQGYLNGEITSDYTEIRSSTNYNELDFWGSATPTIFGALRNTFKYKFIEFSLNITYKLNYYIRRKALVYQSLFMGNYDKPDFNQRWVKPGDEEFTSVPALTYPANSSADSYYSNSSVHVEKGDHIRLQDMQLNVNIGNKQTSSLPFKNINIYTYITNIGIIWKASDKLRDPDIRSGRPVPLSMSFGIKADF